MIGKGYFKEYPALILGLKGPSLKQVSQILGKPFTLDCVNFIAVMLLSMIEKIHMLGVIHRNISPSKILIGSEYSDPKLYLIDFKEAFRLSSSTSNPSPHFESLINFRARRPSIG